MWRTTCLPIVTLGRGRSEEPELSLRLYEFLFVNENLASGLAQALAQSLAGWRRRRTLKKAIENGAAGTVAGLQRLLGVLFLKGLPVQLFPLSWHGSIPQYGSMLEFRGAHKGSEKLENGAKQAVNGGLSRVRRRRGRHKPD